MKKVLFIHNVFPSGGAERITIDIADYVTNNGYSFYVVACLLKEKHNNIHQIQLPDKTDLYSLENANFLIDFINTEQIDVCVLPVQGMEHMNYIQTKSSAKWVFSLHCTPLWEVTCGLFLKKRKVEGNILKTLEWFFLTYPKTMWLKKKRNKQILDYLQIYNQVSAYTVLTEEYKQILIKNLHLSPTNNKIHVIYNSESVVDTVNFKKKNQVVFVGRLTYVDKRVDRLLNIWQRVEKKVSDWELIIVGDGEESVNLKNKAQELKLQHVSFVGHTNNVQLYYDNDSIICLTSTFEGWPLCLSEAQANGVIPIAFDCTAGIHEMLSPSGVNGFLIPPFNLRKYAKTLLALMKDSEKQNAMRPGLIAKAAQYAPEIIGEKWLNLFESLLNDEK